MMSKDNLIYFDKIYNNLLGYTLNSTELKIKPNIDFDGIYLPRNQTAIVKDNNLLSLFHEYFGHGLFFERSLLGKKLLNLEKQLLKEEMCNLPSSFSLNDLKKFRENNEIYKKIINLRNNHLIEYESFAIWSEYFLSKKLDIVDLFDKKYKVKQKLIEDFINFNNTNGDLATFYAYGLERITTVERAKRLLEDIYKNKLNDMSLITLYGSKKNFSDIDIFMVGRYPKEIHFSFLDVKAASLKDLNNGIKNFDIRITTPIIQGELVRGDREYFNSLKNKILAQPISRKAIDYNLKRSEKMRRLSIENKEVEEKFINYYKTYLANALALKEGKRIFGKQNFLNYITERRLK